MKAAVMTATDAKQKAFAPPHYLRRRRGSPTAGKYSNWEQRDWLPLTPRDYLDAEGYVNQWNSMSEPLVGTWEYKLPLACERCYTVVSETYPAIGLVGMIGKHVCMKCHLEGMENMAPKKATGDLLQKYNPVTGKWQLSPLSPAQTEGLSKPTLVRKEGDIWKLPRSSSPMWTNQWGYQGSSKIPYIISHNSQKLDGSATDDGWACSCPGFTRRTPRTPCKHILNVRLKEGIGVSQKAQTKLANLDDKTAAEFEKWQREKAAAGKVTPTAGDAKLNLFGATGRKFR